MKKLTITQTYFSLLVGAKSKRTISDHSEQGLGLIISNVLDLIIDGYVALDEKGKLVKTSFTFPKDHSYLSPVAVLIQEKGPLKIEKLVTNYMLGFKNSLTTIFKAVGDSLVQEDIVMKTSKKQLIGSSEYYLTDAAYLSQLEAELKDLIDKNWTFKELSLVTVLEKGKILKKYLSAAELRTVKMKIKQFQKQPEAQMIKGVMNAFESLLVAATSVYTG